jgi:hypothetical protein
MSWFIAVLFGEEVVLLLYVFNKFFPGLLQPFALGFNLPFTNSSRGTFFPGPLTNSSRGFYSHLRLDLFPLPYIILRWPNAQCPIAV